MTHEAPMSEIDQAVVHAPDANTAPDGDGFKVLHVITRLIVGGAQETVLETVEGLRKRGYDASFIVGPQTGPEGQLLDEADAAGIPYRVLPPLLRQVSPIDDFKAFVSLCRIMGRERPTVVHTHSSKAGVLGRVAARFTGVPVVVHTVHGWGFNERQRPTVRAVFTTLERMLAPLTDRLIAVSTQCLEVGLASRIGAPARYALIRSGIEVTDFASPARPLAKSDLGIDRGAPVVGTVTRLSPQKCPEDFVSVARAVLDRTPAAHFVVVGDGPLRPQVERRIAEAGIQDRVHLLGLRRDVAGILQTFDVFLATSHWEGLPRTFLQAIAAGKPIVTTRVHGALDVIEPGVTGYVEEIGDIEGLAGRVVELLEDPRLAERMGAAARSSLAVEFTSEVMVEATDALYRTLLPASLPRLARGSASHSRSRGPGRL